MVEYRNTDFGFVSVGNVCGIKRKTTTFRELKGEVNTISIMGNVAIYLKAGIAAVTGV